MTILCMLGRHAAPERAVWNCGVHLSEYSRRDRDTLGRAAFIELMIPFR